MSVDRERAVAALEPVAASWSNHASTIAVVALPLVVALGILAVFMVRTLLEAGFMVLWFAILTWNAYLLLFRIARRLEIRGRTLHWYAVLRRGAVPVADVQAISKFLGPSMLVLRTSEGISPVIYPRGTFPAFLRVLHRMNPALPERLSLSTRILNGPWSR